MSDFPGQINTDEAYVVYGADKTVRDFFRNTQKVGGTVLTYSQCGSGTYVFANGVVTTTIQETSPNADPTKTAMTETVTKSANVEFIDDSMRITTDVDGSSNVAVYKRGTLPDGLEASCPK